MKKKTSKKQKILDIISKLEITESLSRDSVVEEIYNDNDYFIRRSFDVIFCSVRKELFPKIYTMQKGIITRTA